LQPRPALHHGPRSAGNDWFFTIANFKSKSTTNSRLRLRIVTQGNRNLFGFIQTAKQHAIFGGFYEPLKNTTSPHYFHVFHRGNASSRLLQAADGLPAATGRGWALELACRTGSGPVRRYSSVKLIIRASRPHRTRGPATEDPALSLLARTPGGAPLRGLSSRRAMENGRGRLSWRSRHTGGAAEGTVPGLAVAARNTSRQWELVLRISEPGTKTTAVFFSSKFGKAIK